MRILFLAARDGKNPGSAGGDTVVTAVARQLAAAGHAVTLVGAQHPELPRQETDGGLHIRRLAPHWLLAPAVWAQLLFGMAGTYDLVLEDLVTGERLPFFARVLTRKPTIGFWFQDNRPLFRTTYGPLGQLVAQGVQFVLLGLYRDGPFITLSRTTRDWLVRRGVPATKVLVYRPSVERPKNVDPKRPFSQRRNRFVVIANFRPYKRMEEAIEVLSLLRQQIPDATLTLIGRPDSPSYLESLRRLAKRLPPGDGVTFELAVSEDRKFEVLNQSKALTVHSPIEGLGLTLIEAGFCGVPAVVSSGVPPEAFRAGQSGEVVREGGAAGYAAVLGAWMKDAARWQAYSAGSEVMAEEFVHGSSSTDLETFLEAAPALRRSGAPG